MSVALEENTSFPCSSSLPSPPPPVDKMEAPYGQERDFCLMLINWNVLAKCMWTRPDIFI